MPEEYNKYKNNLLKKAFMALVFLVSLMLTGVKLYAQSPSAVLEKDQIVLGEQLKLTLKVSDIPDGSKLSSFFTWGNSPHAEVVSKGKMDTVVLNGSTTYIQNWTVTSFDSGKWALPILPATIIDGGKAKVLTIKDSIYLNVMSVDISNMKDYHDIKDILTVKYFDPFWIIVAIVTLVVIILLIIIIRYFIRKRNKKPKTQKITGNPLDWALDKINQLQKKEVSAYVYFTELNEIVRNYLNEKTSLTTMQKTSEELIMKMKSQYKEDVVNDGFYQNLRLMDAVKFAKFQPSSEIRQKVTKDIKGALTIFDNKTKESQTKQ